MDPALGGPEHQCQTGESPVRDGRRGAGWTSVEGLGLLALLGFTLLALLGYGLYGVRPDRLPEVDLIVSFWQISFQFFAQVHIILGALVLGIAMVRWGGVRWVPALVGVYLVAFLSEHLGTGTGLPFGNYEYTALLGWKLGGRVPWVIPLSWFLMAVPSYALARVTFPAPGRRWSRLVFAAFILTLWDLALDPAMSYQSPYYWRWTDTGPYYGMPWINLAGWLGTGLVIMLILEGLGRGWIDKMSVPWLLAYYGVTLLMPFGMLILEGLWLAVVVTVAGYGVAWLFHQWVRRSRSVGGKGTDVEGSSPSRDPELARSQS